MEPSRDQASPGEGRPLMRSIAGRLRRVPPEPILIGLGLFTLLAAFVAADPAAGVSFSSGPYGDEAYNVINARNLVLFGRWATDAWDHHFVNLPFSLLEAGVFRSVGIGMVQARLAMVLCTSLTATALAWGLRRTVGRAAALFAGLAFATSGLVLYYGRLAFLEDLVVLGLTLGTLVLARESRLNLRWGLAAGLCFTIAIGTKPSAAFSVVGILVALGLMWGWRDRAVRRWLLGTTIVIAVAGLAWAVLFWLPNQEAIGTDVKIWQPSQFYLTPMALLKSVGSYAIGGNDHLYGMLLGPLLVLSAAGSAAIVALRRYLSQDEARLAVAAFGWAVFGFGILMMVSYRPNRYVVPLVPALAILACIGLHVTAEWLKVRISGTAHAPTTAGPDEESTAVSPRPLPLGHDLSLRPARNARLVVPLLAAVAIAFSAAPGLASYAAWAPNATYQLVGIQNQMAANAPQDETVAGNHTALFMLTSKSILVVTGIANTGDQYASGNRWYLNPVDAPPPVGVPASAWSARQVLLCVSWRDTRECLYHVP